MIHRILQNKAKYFSKKYPVITITGPRQSGKTTLVKETFPEHEYFSLENPSTRRMVTEDPSLLFYPEGKKIIIDEIQRVPELLSYIQAKSDQYQIKGQFILTGSQSLLLSEKVSQTLAGRTALLKLMPFSLRELKNLKSFKKDDYTDWIYRGFYPRIYKEKLNPGEFYPFYFETYVQRDVREIQNIRDLNQFSNFVRLCAGRVGQIVDYTSMANDTGVSVNTVRGWISLLEASFIVHLIHPYYKNFGKRMIKSPKLYFTDTGLVCFLLNVTSPSQLETHYLRGSLFENLIIMELLKSRLNRALPSNLWYYRDSNKNEIDCILDEDQIKAIEIKSGRTFSDEFHRGLKLLAKNSGMASMIAYVIYGGTEDFQIGDTRIISWNNLEKTENGSEYKS